MKRFTEESGKMTLTDVAVNSDFVQGLDGCIISGDILAGKINIMLSEHSLVGVFNDWMSSILYQLQLQKHQDAREYSSEAGGYSARSGL